jgi:Asp-tRNA(Asn)/Glu-tRNA(Gln) amidotransferase A subunit family amidase
MNDPIRLPAAEMARMVRQKTISPVELVKAQLERIERLNPLLNAFVELDADHALLTARAAEAAVVQGRELGPLHGVPITIKSSIDVAGLRCEAGSRLRRGYVAGSDAPLVTRLKAAGAIVLGNTNVPDLLMAWETDNLIQGRTNNPWDLERTPGGSSGGESAAISACLSAAGVGSDGGGSIRVPAHFTGICGLKPTPGRIPCPGHFPPSAGPFAQLGVVGPMARTVVDLKVLFEVMAGPDAGDPSAAPVPIRYLSAARTQGMRVGYFAEGRGTPATVETRAAVRSAVQALKQSGFAVEPFQFDELEYARELWWVMFGLAGGWVLRPMIQGREANLHPILKEFVELVAAEPPLTLDRFMATLLERDRVRTELLRQMENFPILLCPVCSVPAFRHRERSWPVDGKTVQYLEAMSYSQWVNILGLPAAVVPVAKSREGLPIGVQVVGRPWEEEVVLAVAAEIEGACGGWQEPPVGCKSTREDPKVVN